MTTPSTEDRLADLMKAIELADIDATSVENMVKDLLKTAYNRGYIDGLAMARKQLRVILGLGVPEDLV